MISLRKKELVAMLLVGMKHEYDYVVEEEGASCFAFRWFVACASINTFRKKELVAMIFVGCCVSVIISLRKQELVAMLFVGL